MENLTIACARWRERWRCLRGKSSAPLVMRSVHGGSAAVNRGADCVQHLVPAPLAPEQGTGPDTAHRSIKLRLPDRRTAPVSTAIIDHWLVDS